MGWSDGVTTAERTDTDITADLSVTADFVLKDQIYAVAYIPGPGGTITGETLQTVKRGGPATTVTAVALPGYAFESWSDGVATPSRTDNDIKSNLSVTAIFESDQPIAFAGGTGTASDPYQIADAAQLKRCDVACDINAISEGNLYVGGMAGNINNPRVSAARNTRRRPNLP